MCGFCMGVCGCHVLGVLPACVLGEVGRMGRQHGEGRRREKRRHEEEGRARVGGFPTEPEQRTHGHA